MVYGLDVHKEFIQVCALGADGRRDREFRIGGTAAEIESFAETLGPEDAVALEATFHSWSIHRILKRHAGRVVVGNPLATKAIAHARIKTDKVDAHTLAQLLRADYLPAVEMPDEATWARRQLLSHRQLLVKHQRSLKNTIHAVFNRLLLPRPEGDPFSRKNRSWMRAEPLPETERLLVDNALELLEQTEVRVAAVDERLLKLASVEASAKLLVTVPGVNVTVAMALLATIGDVRRFPTPGQLSAYFGLVPRLSQSAGRCHHGSITKAGSSTARSLAIEAAQVVARSGSPLSATYWRVRRKRGHNVAVTALARKLIVVVWHLLQHGEPYRYAPPTRTRFKLRRLERERRRVSQVPQSLEEVYREAQLPELASPRPAERRAAARNRAVITRLSRLAREGS